MAIAAAIHLRAIRRVQLRDRIPNELPLHRATLSPSPIPAERLSRSLRVNPEHGPATKVIQNDQYLLPQVPLRRLQHCILPHLLQAPRPYTQVPPFTPGLRLISRSDEMAEIQCTTRSTTPL